MPLRVATIAAALLFAGCSDGTEPLGRGYFLRDEGGTTRDILCERGEGREVPATVTAVASDGTFILARQHPKLPQDPLYKAEYVYPDPSRDAFWIIDTRDDSADGPLSEAAYEAARRRLGVPEGLVLEP